MYQDRQDAVAADAADATGDYESEFSSTDDEGSFSDEFEGDEPVTRSGLSAKGRENFKRAFIVAYTSVGAPAVPRSHLYRRCASPLKGAHCSCRWQGRSRKCPRRSCLSRLLSERPGMSTRMSSLMATAEETPLLRHIPQQHSVTQIMPGIDLDSVVVHKIERGTRRSTAGLP